MAHELDGPLLSGQLRFTLESPSRVESTPDPELHGNHHIITSAALPFDNSLIWCQYFNRKG